MDKVTLLARDWRAELVSLIRSARQSLFIASPYVTREGAELLLSEAGRDGRGIQDVTLLTNLSPDNVCNGSTDPAACKLLTDAVSGMRLYHLPRLHAKVYIGDTSGAIVTSANLTRGGLHLNYEYGLRVNDRVMVMAIRDDLGAYAKLGALIPGDRLGAYCVAAENVRRAFRQKLQRATKWASRQFEEALRTADDELIRLRLAGGAVHTVFARTILYLLRRYGPLATADLHPLVEQIHPDLCDNTVDRVIDGKRFGKKWKHAVRTAQQQLKSQGLVALVNERWRLVSVAEEEPK